MTTPRPLNPHSLQSDGLDNLEAGTGGASDSVMQLPLSQGFFALVDREDYETLSQFKWNAFKNKYTVYGQRWAVENGLYRLVRLHREILKPPAGLVVDHADGNGLNNTRSNLRLATRSQNNSNRAIRSDNSSGYVGISPIRSKWRAVIQVRGKIIHLGAFSDLRDAVEARNAAAIQYFGEFARLAVVPERQIPPESKHEKGGLGRKAKKNFPGLSHQKARNTEKAHVR